jgi:hypothetical protein
LVATKKYPFLSGVYAGVIFLLCAPVRRPSRPARSVTHTSISFTYNLITQEFVIRPTFSHTQRCKHTHTHIIVTHTPLSRTHTQLLHTHTHTTLSHTHIHTTVSHTHTRHCHTYFLHTHTIVKSFAHTDHCHTQLCNPQLPQLCHTHNSFTHTHISFTYSFVTHTTL